MLAGPLIVALAAVLAIYWFRYVCRLALSAKKEPDCLARVAAVNGLSFLVVQTKLRLGESGLEALDESLNEDYRVLQYLLRHATGGRRLESLEQQMLVCDYHVMALWYRCVGKFSGAQARKALEERSRIVSYLAHRIALRTGSRAAA